MGPAAAPTPTPVLAHGPDSPTSYPVFPWEVIPCAGVGSQAPSPSLPIPLLIPKLHPSPLRLPSSRQRGVPWG